MSRAVLIVTLLVSASGAGAGQAFDGDRYHERQDACREFDAAQRACGTFQAEGVTFFTGTTPD
jgi:hypothetical protein